MKCIFCGKENVVEEHIIDNGNIITCNDCKGKYSIVNNKNMLIKNPKWNINPLISPILLVFILPFGLIFHFLPEIKNEHILKILRFVFFIYANLIPVSMIIVSIQNIYNYITKGYMLSIGAITTREDDSLQIRIIGIIRNLTSGISSLIITILMDLFFLGYFTKP